MVERLKVNEIYLSLQGESTFAGLPCIFVRLTACNLRCSYCDSAYAFTEGSSLTLAAILARIHELAAPFPRKPGGPGLPLVELTGGEPLLQAGALPLLRTLCNEEFTVLLETSGALDISPVDARVHRIMDLKCPSSGEAERNRWENLPHLKATDEIKFVIGTHEDFDWAKSVMGEHHLSRICPLLFSWASPLQAAQQHPSLKPRPAQHTPLTRQQLAERILADALPVRFQLQMHKFVWPADARGV
jgi:7-carboxy-7-deazaguanine synthase